MWKYFVNTARYFLSGLLFTAIPQMWCRPVWYSDITVKHMPSVTTEGAEQTTGLPDRTGSHPTAGRA
jgi:hypothetical protein